MKEDYEKNTVKSEALLKFFLADDHNKEDVVHHPHKYILHMLDFGMLQQKLYCKRSDSYIKELKKQKDESI